jgi:hypothetical protein
MKIFAYYKMRFLTVSGCPGSITAFDVNHVNLLPSL